MRLRILPRSTAPRRGAAIAEMAILLSILSFLFVVCIDFARVFYFSLTLKNCARNGAYYASDYPGIYSYGSASNAALADGGNLNPALTASNVTVGYDSSATGTFFLTARGGGHSPFRSFSRRAGLLVSVKGGWPVRRL